MSNKRFDSWQLTDIVLRLSPFKTNGFLIFSILNTILGLIE